jgi:hypothetical protein
VELSHGAGSGGTLEIIITFGMTGAVEPAGMGAYSVVDYDLQHYVPVPVTGAAPVTSIARADLDVAVQWQDEAGTDIEAPGYFVEGTVYGAEITVTTKAPWGFDTAIPFGYADGAVEVNDLDLTYRVPMPTVDGTPVTYFSALPQYTGTVDWFTGGSAHSGLFRLGEAYRAEATLTPAEGYAFGDVAAGAFTHGGADDKAQPPNPAAARNSDGTVTVTVTFGPAAAVIPVPTPIILTNLVPKPVMGDSPVKNFPGGSYSGTVTWDPPHGIFLAGTIYTAEVTLTPAPGYFFPDGAVQVIHGEADTITFLNTPSAGSALRRWKITFTNPGFFSGPYPADAVDQILASESSPATTITLGAGREEVSLGTEDLPAGGLVLRKTGGIPTFGGGGVAIYQGSFIMIGGSITSNEARNYGGGVGICLPNAGGPTDPSFAKTGGLITTKNETAPNRPDLELEFDGNSVIGEDGKKKTDKGHAVYYNPDGLYREAMDASPALIMNSEEAGGWDNWPSPLP